MDHEVGGRSVALKTSYIYSLLKNIKKLESLKLIIEYKKSKNQIKLRII